jgi:dienelactone hydrolase
MKKLVLLFAAAVSTATIQAKVVTQSVAYEHQGVKLEGFLAFDDVKTAPGNAPGVLVIPEWWGLNDYVKGRAQQLADLGYIAFVADMYGAGQSTTDAKKAGELAKPFYGSPLMATRANAGLEQLLKQKKVDAKHIAAIGYCFGGSTVQALAYTGAPLVGIVSFHGGLIPVPADAATKNKAKFLMCSGAIDPMVPAKDVESFMQAMNAGKFDYQFISYSGALHAFTNPGADAAAVANGMQGQIGYNAAADHRSWAAMTSFFGEIFPNKEKSTEEKKPAEKPPEKK